MIRQLITIAVPFFYELSKLNRLTPIECLFEFYEAYKSNVPINKREPFDLFSKWANKVLKDFDEIDKHLVQPEKVFKYLKLLDLKIKLFCILSLVLKVELKELFLMCFER